MISIISFISCSCIFYWTCSLQSESEPASVCVCLLCVAAQLQKNSGDTCPCETPCNLTRYGKELSMVKIPSKGSARYLSRKYDKSEDYIRYKLNLQRHSPVSSDVGHNEKDHKLWPPHDTANDIHQKISTNTFLHCRLFYYSIIYDFKIGSSSNLLALPAMDLCWISSGQY